MAMFSITRGKLADDLDQRRSRSRISWQQFSSRFGADPATVFLRQQITSHDFTHQQTVDREKKVKPRQNDANTAVSISLGLTIGPGQP